MWIAIATLNPGRGIKCISPGGPWPANSALNQCVWWWRRFTHKHRGAGGGGCSLTPEAKAPSRDSLPSNSQHCPLICWHFCLIQTAKTWYSWLHVISGIVLRSICPPPPLPRLPSVKYNAFNSPAFCLGYFFHLWQRQRTVCLLVLAKGQRLFLI